MITPGKAHLVHYDPQIERRIAYLRRSGRYAEAELEIEEHNRIALRQKARTEHACKIQRAVKSET